MTLRQIAVRLSAGYTHLCPAGTATQIADIMEHWFRSGACDGFLVSTLLPPWPALDEFVTLVVPELQRRGIFRTAYEGTTLRDNLGLPPFKLSASEEKL
jgi:alkanesulfonate monooxygenase SsuD/methylene tetrahydromethanopterin reductase-like flavin-dependent oxidoreductase (luciferase family)